MPTQISINHFQRTNWTLEDLNGKVALEATYKRPSDPSSGVDGFNILVKAPGIYSGETWMTREEVASLRDWLNKALDNG
jgi:hypothetical protein